MANAPEKSESSWDLFRSRRFPLHVHISLFFTILLLITGLVIGLTNYIGTRAGLLNASREYSGQLGELTELSLDRMQTPISNLTALLSRSILAGSKTETDRLKQLPLLLEALSLNPFLSAVYAGYDNGDFFIVRNLRTDLERKILKAPPDTRYLVQSMERKTDTVTGRFLALDDDYKTRATYPMDDFGFDPRVRPWFKEATQSNSPIRTAPYVFYANRDIGQTFACKAPDGGVVVGADIALTTLSQTLANIRPTPSARLLVFDENTRTIADSNGTPAVRINPDGNPSLTRLADNEDALIRAIGENFLADGEGVREELDDQNGRYWFTSSHRIGKTSDNDMFMAVIMPLDEMLSDARSQMKKSALATAIILVFSLPLVWFMSRRVSHDLRKLAGVAESIQHFNFTSDMRLASGVKEVQDLSEVLTHTQTTIQKFLDLSTTAASERDFARLEEFILLEMMRVTNAKAGVLYLLDDDILNPECARIISGATGAFEALPDVPGLNPADADTLELALALAEGQPRTAMIPAGSLPSERMRALWHGEQAHSILMALRNNEGANVGVIALYKSGIGDRESEAGMLAFIRQLSGVTAITLENHRLLLAQEELMQSMIRILAGAIDAKSPYTGGHCQRVPVITVMLAEAACESDAGPFAGYTLDNDAWKALKVAAWLHDCGKVTTPEYVVDKATKLETIYDRIHEIRMRFEVLKREAEIECLKEKAAGVEPAEAERRLAETWRALDDDFSFVAQCNEGSEAMKPGSQERLARIAQRTWTRTLSDRLGISWEEKMRRQSEPEPILPVEEHLLADKPEHLLPRPAAEWSAEHNPWGFTMKMPKYKFNRGELTNLSINRGTLSEEERFIINDHIIQTIIMLSRLQFSGAMRNVPEIAGGHHERMDGKGYPKGLTGAQMSVEARMMAIADVFEALTASDRPYKRAKTLSESLSIMSNMARSGHLDPVLFELFLKKGVYQRYAESYLTPEQRDTVSIDNFLPTENLDQAKALHS